MYVDIRLYTVSTNVSALTCSITVAQMPYQSGISGRQEHRPIASTLIAAKGSDLMLIRLAKAAFNAAGWPTEIDTGRYMYPVGDNLRNVARSTEALSYKNEDHQPPGQSVL